MRWRVFRPRPGYWWYVGLGGRRPGWWHIQIGSVLRRQPEYGVYLLPYDRKRLIAATEDLPRIFFFFFFFLVKEPVISLYRNTEDSATRIFANSETWRMGLFNELLQLRVLQYIRVAETGT